MQYLKKRWHEMYLGRRIIVLVQPVLFLLFLILFLIFGRQQIVSYRSGHLRYEQRGDTAVYSGMVDYRATKYVVSPGPVVEYWLDGELRGTYTVTEDPTAIPQTEDVAKCDPDFFTGVEIKKGDKVWFRGAYSPYSSFYLLDENGNNIAITITFDSATSEPEPTPGTILRFANGPEASPRGSGPGLLLGLLLGAVCVLSILFEDQLFRWQLSFQIQDPDRAEPSEWELFGRWMGWISLTGLAAFIYAAASGLILIS